MVQRPNEQVIENRISINLRFFKNLSVIDKYSQSGKDYQRIIGKVDNLMLFIKRIRNRVIALIAEIQ